MLKTIKEFFSSPKPKAYMEVYPDKSPAWRWRLKSAGNHEIIASSGEPFATKGSATRAARGVVIAVHSMPVPK